MDQHIMNFKSKLIRHMCSVLMHCGKSALYLLCTSQWVKASLLTPLCSLESRVYEWTSGHATLRSACQITGVIQRLAARRVTLEDMRRLKESEQGINAPDTHTFTPTDTQTLKVLLCWLISSGHSSPHLLLSVLLKTGKVGTSFSLLSSHLFSSSVYFASFRRIWWMSVILAGRRTWIIFFIYSCKVCPNQTGHNEA